MLELSILKIKFQIKFQRIVFAPVSQNLIFSSILIRSLQFSISKYQKNINNQILSQVAKLEAENEELRGKVTISEKRREEEKKIELSNNKPKSIETTTRIGHTIYTGNICVLKFSKITIQP